MLRRLDGKRSRFVHGKLSGSIVSVARNEATPFRPVTVDAGEVSFTLTTDFLTSHDQLLVPRQYLTQMTAVTI